MKPYLKKQVTNNNLWRPYVYYWNTFPGRWPFVEPHYHPEFAIHYMVKGSMLFSLNEEHVLASEGDIIFIQPNTVYSITPPNDLIGMKNYHTFIFDSDFLCGSVGASCYTEILSPIIQNQVNFSRVITKEHPYYDSHCLNKDIPALAYFLDLFLYKAMIEFNENQKRLHKKEVK